MQCLWQYSLDMTRYDDYNANMSKSCFIQGFNMESSEFVSTFFFSGKKLQSGFSIHTVSFISRLLFNSGSTTYSSSFELSHPVLCA